MTSLSSEVSPTHVATNVGVALAIAAVLRDETGAAEQLAALDVQDVLASARHHGVAGLLRKALSHHPLLSRSLSTLLDAEVRLDGAAGSWRTQQATRVIDGLHRAGVATLVLKGDALAHTHYSAPHLRPRCDTDVLVRSGDIKRAQAVLASLGYLRQPMADRDAVRTQCSFGLTDRSQTHFVDLHWAVSIRPLFPSMTTFEELARDARPLDALGEYARTPSPVWSLLLGCIHRIGPDNDNDRLIWLYDFKLLADGLTDEEWALFWALASGRDVVEACRAGLSLADMRLRLGPAASRALARRVSPRHYEPAFEPLGRQMTTLQLLALDARAVRGVIAKARLVASHVLPDRRYMREVFHVRTRLGLVAAYVRRATVGAWRLIH
jgi:hypothetical protein